MKMKIIEGPVTDQGTQTGVGVIKVSQLVEIFDVSQYDPDKGSPGEEGGYQRLAKKSRFLPLANKIGKKGLVVANAILVNVRKEDAVPKKLVFDNDGITSVDLPKKIWIEDGQHRVEAWKEVYDNPEKYNIDKDDFGETKVCFVMYWGSDIEEEVNTFFDTNNFSKGLELENRLELDIFLSKVAHSEENTTHTPDEDLVMADEVVKELEQHHLWEGKIKKANSTTGIVPRSALLQSVVSIFKVPQMGYLTIKQRKQLLVSIWEALNDVFPEIFSDDKPRDWALQKAIGINIIHKLVPEIYADIHNENENRGKNLDKLVKESYLPYFKKMLSIESADSNLLNGLNFWKAGKEGGAGQYSSGQGKNMLFEIYKNAIIGKKV